jgi:hypothetical protein
LKGQFAYQETSLLRHNSALGGFSAGVRPSVNGQ